MHLFSRKAIVLFLAIALVMALVPLGSVQAATKWTEVAQTPPPNEVWVGYNAADGVTNFDTIQAAVDAVASEGLIHVNGGTHNLITPITIDKPLKIYGFGSDAESPLINGKFILASQGATAGLLKLFNLRFVDANGAITIGDAAEASFDQVELSNLSFGTTAVDDSKAIQTASSVQIKDLKILYCTVFAAHGIDLNGDFGSAAINDNTFFLTDQNVGSFSAIKINQDTKVADSGYYPGLISILRNTLNIPVAEPNSYASAILNQASFTMTSTADGKMLTVDGNKLVSGSTAIAEQALFIKDEIGSFVPVLPVKIDSTGATYATIQAAIIAAGSGDTIIVEAGEYVEVGQIVINKNLSIIGADKVTTIIKPAQNTGDSGDARGWFLVNPGVQFNLSNVTLDGAGKNIYEAIRELGTGTINNNIVKNIRHSQYLGFGIVSMGGNMTISNNTFTNIERVGIFPYGSGVTAGVITGNTYTGKGNGDWLDYGIEVGGGAKVTISDNTISGIGNSTTAWTSSAIIVTDTYPTNGPASVIITENNLSNNYDAIHVGYGDSYGVIVVAEKNNLSGTTYAIATTTNLVQLVDGSPNWFGSEVGPTGNQIDGNVNYVPWCTNAACTEFAPTNGVVELSGTYNMVGGIQINAPGLTYHLAADTVIQNDSPCFIINTNDFFIDAEIGAKCLPTGTSNGIDLAAGLSGIRISDLEFDGSAQAIGSTGSGVVFAGAVDHFQLLNNYMHDLKGSGVVFTRAPSNNDGITGNLFKNLGAAAVVVPTGLDPDLDAQYNAWGSILAPTITDVNTSNNTHVALRIMTSGTFLPDKLAVGQTLTATVVADLSNVTGADFILTYPTGLLEIQSVENLSDMTLNRDLTDFPATGKLRFDASVPFDNPTVPITQTGKEMFTVTFVAKTVGTATLALDELTDLFAMSPSSGYSNHIYAYEVVDKPENILIVADDDTPILEGWLPLKGSTLYLNASKQLELVIDAKDSHLYELELDHRLEADTQLPEFSVYADAANPYGTEADRIQFLAAGVTVSYDATNQVWTINFGSIVTDRIINDHGGLITFYAVLKDEFGKNWGSMSPTTVDNTFAYTIVRDVTAPALESWTPAEGQVILTPTGDFVLTVDALDAYLYSLEIYHNLQGTLPEFTVYASTSDTTGGHLTDYTTAGVTVAYDAGTQTWTITFKNGGPALNAILANKGITFYEVLKDMAGNELGSMNPPIDENTFAYQIYKQQPIAWDPSHTGGALTTTVSPDGNTINFTGPIAWYPADSALGRTSGNRVGVEIKAPYLGFDTSLSTLTFDGTTYPWNTVKDGDNFVWVYPKATTVPQPFTITVNWSTTVSQVFTVNVLDTSTLVAPTGFTVQGTISMQGRVYRGDVPINLDGYNADNYAITSQDKLGINYTSNVVLGSYTFTTSQDRYLNVTTTMGKTVTVNGAKTLASLTLRGGNVNNDEKVYIGDATMVGTDYGKTGDPLTLLGDANFDGVVNIQDLAMVGGNYNLTDTAAYDLWVP